MINDVSPTKTTTDLHQLARYIHFHTHPHASFYNTIEGILAPPDSHIEADIRLIMGLLGRDYVSIYNDGQSEAQFLTALAQALQADRTVIIFSDSPNFHPVIYDQLMSIRQHNSFTVSLPDNQGPLTIHPGAKLFIVFSGIPRADIAKVYELTDHVLDVSERRQ